MLHYLPNKDLTLEPRKSLKGKEAKVCDMKQWDFSGSLLQMAGQLQPFPHIRRGPALSLQQMAV